MDTTIKPGNTGKAPQTIKQGNSGGTTNQNRHKVLVVDDDPTIRALLCLHLEDAGHIVLLAGSGQEALDIITQNTPDLILLDVLMPGMDGFDTAVQIKKNPDCVHTPIIIITALDDTASRIRGLEAGAVDFLNKPIDTLELGVRVHNLLKIKDYNDFLEKHNRILEQQVNNKTQQVRQQCIDTVLTLAKAAEYRDEDTGIHVNRISHYTVVLAEQLGLDTKFRDRIFYASPMHDIGKLAIPDHILLKPGRFTAGEWEIMKTHTTLGKEILSGNHSPYLDMGADIALHHHEHWDGSGYPSGLVGEQISLPARLMQICDIYDALRSKRPYKSEVSHEDTVKIIRSGDTYIQPQQFDPDILYAFMASSDQFSEIYAESTAISPRV